MSDDRLAEIRAALMSGADLREKSASLVEAMLLDLEGLDDDDPPPEWYDGVANVPANVGELRARLRLTLAEIAARDGGSA
jgi:hypothetical protein